MTSMRYARAVLSFLAEPGDPALGALLRTRSPAEIVAALSAGQDPSAALAAAPADRRRLRLAVGRWRARLGLIPDAARLAAWQRGGIRLVCPDDAEWPGRLDDLADARPLVLWVRGGADLRQACLRSVSVVGSRAATAYGSHVCTELAASLAQRGLTVVSGGAYGIDGCAHRAALAVGGLTVAVLACGVDRPYPAGHAELFGNVTARGALVSEWPPGSTPTRHGFLVRNRVIAALTSGTVVVEAGLRSGALSTARHARDLCRPLMAVPGPVTSDSSAGCHEILRNWAGVCVTCADDVLELVSPVGDHLAERRRGPARPHDALDPVTASVLDAVPARSGTGPAAIAVSAGVDLDTVIGCLGALAAGGFVERGADGWRTRRRA